MKKPPVPHFLAKLMQRRTVGSSFVSSAVEGLRQMNAVGLSSGCQTRHNE
jgi:hypothetical protein